MHKVLFFSIVLALPVSSYADSYKEKQNSNDVDLKKSEMGYWKPEDCRKVSEASGLFLAIAGGILEKSGKVRDQGKTKEAEKLFEAALKVSEVARNFAINFQSYCKQ